MKNVILLSLLYLALFSCSEKSNSEKKNNAVTYGESFDASQAKDISQLPALMKTSDSVSIVLSGTIEKTCAVKGCWMQLKTGEKNNLRVTFKDYAFFVPKSGAKGNNAIVNGYCVKQETSIEELRHYAKDAGESEETIAMITEPKMEYNFVASCVIIED